MANGFRRGEIVLGYCGMERGKGFANYLIRTWRMMHSVDWISSAVCGRPYRGCLLYTSGEIVVPVVMAAAMTTSMDAMASSKGWRIMSGFMVRRWFCPNAGCGFCSRQGAENSALRSLVGNGRYKGNYIFRCTLLSCLLYTSRCV